MIRKLFLALSIVLIILLTACDSNTEQYEFPVSKTDMENVLSVQELNWHIKEINEVDEEQNIITLTNEDNIIFGIGSMLEEDRKILNMSWALPGSITAEKFDDFYNIELPELLELVGIFYGNKREMDRSLNELLKYYLTESNYENRLSWAKRMGEDHLSVRIGPFSPANDNRNRVGSLLVMNNISYENYMRIINENQKNNGSAEINECTVSELLDFESTANKETAGYFAIHGHIDDIKEIKTIPDTLQNMDIIIPDTDKYLVGKLADDTGSIDVFLQPTSLNKNELMAEREHIIAIVYHEDNPVLIVLSSALTE